MPKKQISIAASKVTKIEKHGKNLYYDGQVVEADNLEHAMSEFLNWLPDKSLLFAHNGKNFDSKILIQTLNSLTLSKEKIVGFVDTLPYFRQKYPELRNHNQNNLSRILLNKDCSCDAHNALNDVLVLRELILYENMPSSLELFLKFSFPVSYVEDSLRYFHRKKQCLVTLSQLSNVTSKSMVEKIAGSGLALDDLKRAFKRGGIDGVGLLLSEKGKNGKPRVTNRVQILEKISQKINSLSAN